MNSTDTFVACDSIDYGHKIGSITSRLSTFKLSDFIYLDRCGLRVVISQGLVKIDGVLAANAAFILDEIQDRLIFDYSEIKDYVEFTDSHYALIDEICIAISTVKSKIEDPTFLDLFQYILEDWRLLPSQIKDLKKLRADKAQENNERVYK